MLQRAITVFLLGIPLALFVATVPRCTPDNSSPTPPAAEPTIEFVTSGLISFGGKEYLLGANSNPDNDLWLVAGENGGESMGALVTRNSNGSATIYGAVFRDSSGNSFEVHIDSIGRPDTVLFRDGAMVLFKNYSLGAVTADLEYYSSSGDLVSTVNTSMDPSLRELMQLVDEYGLTFDDPEGLAKGSALFANAGKINGWSLVLKITGTAISSVACVISIPAATTVALTAAVAAGCISAGQGIVSIVAYIAGEDTLADAAGLHSAVWGAIPCPSGDWGACLTTAIAAIDYMISGCEAENPRATKACKDGWVTWFDDCGQPYEPIEECPCECVGAACIPIEACSSGLALSVNIVVSPPCDTVGEYLFFTSSVAGGDTSSYLYQWSFGDGGTSVLSEDTHAYGKAGTYVATLKVNDLSGNYGFASVPVEVGTCSKVSEIIAESNKECAPVNEPVAFSSLARGGDKLTYKYKWNFGDGATSLEANPGHTYTAEGEYTVSVSVVCGDGGAALTSFVQKVGGCPGSFDVEIGSSKDCARSGEAISFTAQLVGQAELPIEYFWDFGDGATSENNAPSHVWTKEGSYTVSLLVLDESSSLARAEATIEVGNCTDTTSVNLNLGKIVCTAIDTSVTPFKQGVRVIDTRDGSFEDVPLSSGTVCTPLGVSAHGTIVMAETDTESGDTRLVHSAGFGASTPQPLRSTCGDGSFHWSRDDQVSVSENGVAYCHGTYDSTFYDSLLSRTRTQTKHRLLALSTVFEGCSYVPIDVDNNGIYYDRLWDDTDLAIGYSSNKIVFSRTESSREYLYSIDVFGGVPTLLTDQYHSRLAVSADGTRCIFAMDGGEMFNSLGSVSTSGGPVVDLTAVTGLTLMNDGFSVSDDGSTIAVWAMDMTAGSIDLYFVQTDGSSFKRVDTDGVLICSTQPGSFTRDGKGLVFVGTTNKNISEALGDIFYVDSETGTVSNLTATPHVHEDVIFLR